MMDSNQEYVVERWIVAKQGRSGVIWLSHDTDTGFGDWAAAAEFTRTREEEIRQIEEEFALLVIFQAAISHKDVERWMALQRILARLESALAHLTRGMTVRP